MQIIPYLNFNGNCRDALTFYAKLFNETLESLASKGETNELALSARAKKLIVEITNGNVKLGDLALASLPQILFIARESWSAPL